MTIRFVSLLFLAAAAAPSAAILDPGDFLALQAIRKALDDVPGSRFFSSWDFTADPCGFSGVRCAGDRVVALSLGEPRAGSPGLTGRFDPAVGRLTALEELSLAPGRVVGPLPNTLAELTNLQFLGLSRNFLSGAIPPAIGSLVRLRTLDMSFNQFSGSVPHELAAMPSLFNLVLAHNHLSGELPSFSSPALVRLDLKHNNLSGVISALPPSLEYLSLTWNRLSGTVEGILPQLRRLNHLDLSMNQLTGTIPPAVFSLPLNELHLQRNMFSGEVRPEGAVAIPTVDLSYNQLSGPIPPALATAKRLYLNNNRFTGEVPEAFVEKLLNATIQTLYLQHNFLTGMELNPAAEMPMTSSLCLQYNCMVPPPAKMTCPPKAGVAKVRPTSQCVEWSG